MRRALIIGGSILGGSILGIGIVVIAGLFVYAILNLNSIVEANRDRIVASASDALGRKVEVSSIKGSLGWGISIDLSGVTIAGDPAFSNQPLMTAQDVNCKVELLPLLSKRVRIAQLEINSPTIRIIRNQAGDLNVASLGRKSSRQQMPVAATPGIEPTAPALHAMPMEAAPQSKAVANPLNALDLNSLIIANGTVFYQDAAWGPDPIAIRRLDLDLEHFRADAPFDLTLAMAALADRQDLKLKGQMGPLMSGGALNLQQTPLAMSFEAGPLQLADLRAIKPLAGAIPPPLAVDGSIAAKGKVAGTLERPVFDLNTDLSSDKVAYAGILEKPAGVPLIVTASGSRADGNLLVKTANLTLADIRLKATNVEIQPGRMAARLDSNRFDLGPLSQIVVALQKYKSAGAAEIHANVAIVQNATTMDGTLTLANVALSPGGNLPGIEGLSGDLKMRGNAADIGPLNFVLGGGHAQLVAHAASIHPLQATYSLSADQLKTANLLPSRPPNEILNNLKIDGTASGTPSQVSVTANLTSPSGDVNNAAYQNLKLAAQYANHEAVIKSLTLGAFGGAINATATAELAAAHHFNLTADLGNVDIQQALASQKMNAAGIVRGIVTGEVKASGAGINFDQIKPTLAGNGKLTVNKGELIGINVAATALKKVDHIPGIGALLPMPVIARHPELFKNPNTDIDQAKLSFVIEGPRITTHDLTVAASDYQALGEGWFDLNKQIDMAIRLLLTPQFSSEIRANKKNVVYLQNQNGQVAIPLRIVGQLPRPAVVPDVADLAQRAAAQAIQQKGQKAIGKFLGKNGLGGIFGGGNAGGGTAPQGSPTPSNPLNKFKGLF
ncbi:MAG: AsmA family protein [Candidatus Binataceae bacterium]|nr:AsmA family protein [Candidatus Binataceae bacterium]